MRTATRAARPSRISWNDTTTDSRAITAEASAVDDPSLTAEDDDVELPAVEDERRADIAGTTFDQRSTYWTENTVRKAV